MLRIRLGIDDMARLRLAPGGVAGMIETVYSSVHLAAGPVRDKDLTALSRQVRRGLPGFNRLGPLLDLMRPAALRTGLVPEFLLHRTNDPVEYVDHLMRLPAHRLRAGLAAGLDPSPYRRRLAAGDRSALRELAVAVSDYHRGFHALLPAMDHLVRGDLSRRRTVLAEGGTGALLDSLHPTVRWRSPWLEIDAGPDREIDLGGRPVTLTPSVFMRHRQGVLREPHGACFVTYPALGRLTLPTDGSGDPLQDLLGRTRAAVLRAAQDGCSTSELAARTEISQASASEHAAVLRRAGLVTTHRQGRAVHHHVTPLGEQTLRTDQ